MASDSVKINIEIHDLPQWANRVINSLTKIRGTTKRQVVREALVEYATRHQKDISEIAERTRVGIDNATP